MCLCMFRDVVVLFDVASSVCFGLCGVCGLTLDAAWQLGNLIRTCGKLHARCIAICCSLQDNLTNLLRTACVCRHCMCCCRCILQANWSRVVWVNLCLVKDGHGSLRNPTKLRVRLLGCALKGNAVAGCSLACVLLCFGSGSCLCEVAIACVKLRMRCALHVLSATAQCSKAC
jgi:hypothetical protein